MKTSVCKKHREKPAIIYGKCIGCEIDLLRLEVQSLRAEKRRAAVLAVTLREALIIARRSAVLGDWQIGWNVDRLQEVIDAATGL